MPAKKAKARKAAKRPSGKKHVQPRKGRAQTDRPVVAWKARFLERFAITANVKDACAAAGTSTQNYYDTRDKDPVWAKAVDQARLDVLGSVESAVLRRALGESTTDALAYLERYDVEWRKRKEIAGGTLRPIVFSPKLGTLAIVEDDGEDDDA
jgi:hypothetical protein